MALLAERMAVRRQAQAAEAQAAADMAAAAPAPAAANTTKQSMFNAPAPQAAELEAMERQASRERLQRRRQGYTGGIAERFVQNFGGVG